jgi:predicted small secreted protein
VRLTRALSAVTVALALTLTGCGNGVDLGIGDGDSEPTATAATESERRQAMLDYAKCMREQGIDMPDPQFNGDGGVLMQQGKAGETPPDKELVEAAEAACKQHREKAEAGLQKPSAEEQQKMKESMLAFARCMREQGVDFPDPNFDEDGRVTQHLDGTQIDPESQKFKDAEKLCRDKNPGPKVPGAGGAAGAAGGSR